MKKTIQQVLAEHTPALIELAGVVGTAEGLCEGFPCIKVYIEKDTEELRKRLPASIDGFPVSVEEAGNIRALS